MKLFRTYLVLIVAVVVWSPLSCADEDTAIGEDSKFTRANLNADVDRNKAGEYLLEVGEIFYSGSDDVVRRVVDGIPVEVQGYLKPVADKDPKQTQHRRMHLVQRFRSS